MTKAHEVMKGVTEYGEEYGVRLVDYEGHLCVEAINEGGHNGTVVDLKELLQWLSDNESELYHEYAKDTLV